LEKEYTTIKTKEMEEQVEIKVSGEAVGYVFSLKHVLNLPGYQSRQWYFSLL
jgi:hypothetical protein